VVVVLALAPDPLVLPRAQRDRLLAAVAALLPPRHAPIRALERLLGFVEVARVIHRQPVRRHQEDLQPDIDASLLAG
jgi:hypothetical protein